MYCDVQKNQTIKLEFDRTFKDVTSVDALFVNTSTVSQNPALYSLNKEEILNRIILTARCRTKLQMNCLNSLSHRVVRERLQIREQISEKSQEAFLPAVSCCQRDGSADKRT